MKVKSELVNEAPLISSFKPGRKTSSEEISLNCLVSYTAFNFMFQLVWVGRFFDDFPF